MTLTPRGVRLDLKCGKGSISIGEKCHKGTAITAGVALTAGAIAVGVLAARRGGLRSGKASNPKASTGPRVSPPSPRPSGPPRLPGSPKPYGLLPPARPRPSKTARMRANTAAALENARGAIGQTAREEVRRIGQIGNTMATTGEATGMAVKTGLRELRLRTEAARRRFEPGYRAPDQRRLPAGTQPRLPEAGTAQSADPFNPQLPLIPEPLRAERDPRTGQPRRRRAQGFGRSDTGLISFGHPTYVDPAR